MLKDLLILLTAGVVGAATFWVFARKYGSDCIP